MTIVSVTMLNVEEAASEPLAEMSLYNPSTQLLTVLFFRSMKFFSGSCLWLIATVKNIL